MTALADAPVASREPAPSRRKGAGQRWVRWIHVYTSMISLLIVLFFGVTGLTLNHPSWTFGDEVEVSTTSGTLPFTLDAANPDFLAISEFLRETYGVDGTVDDYGVTGTTATIIYKDPGYSADAFVDLDSGSFELTVEQQGFVAVMNDLHKGRDTGSGWRWVIDVSAVILVAISLSGLGLQLFLRRRRRSALLFAGAGALIGVVLILLAI
jgi:hypothetical protein